MNTWTRTQNQKNILMNAENALKNQISLLNGLSNKAQ